jgi:hypothetical protein
MRRNQQQCRINPVLQIAEQASRWACGAPMGSLFSIRHCYGPIFACSALMVEEVRAALKKQPSVAQV